MGTAMGYGMMAAALSAAEKWNAARDWYYEPLTRWTVWVPAVVGVALTIAAIYIYRQRAAHLAMLQAFKKAGDRFGLTGNERIVLERIARLAGLKRFSSIVTMETAFERGVSLLGQSRPVEAMPEEIVKRLSEVIESLRAKLGLEFSSEEDGESGEVVRLEQGDAVTFVHRGSPSAVEAGVARVDGRNVTLQFADEVPLRIGQACVVHRVDGGEQWEYDVSITEPGEGFAVARLIGKPRRRNLRRFVRVPTQRPAYAAAFPFISLDPSEGPPQFVASTLTEIGGPGLRLEAPLKAEAGDRILVVLKMDGDKTIQGAGVVRRVLAVRDEVQALAVEMAGLSESEVGELLKETNAAARRSPAARAGQVPTTAGTQ
ncbi:MAG: hypothetical protein AMK72_09430 [Planctomycetes bacterium SM23_25]|nr:MAG: hypothetical protein AMS14_02610 [Planctomycetes bacterium DG_20]KPK46686.1 MAG: hypothetical protein AMK72_09430 [Planctomycetes bacterium SM23_25]